MFAEVGREPFDDDARAFVHELCLGPADAAHVENNLREFPGSVRSRGVFFLGVKRLLEQQIGKESAIEALQLAGVSSRIVPFATYPHRDFYKIYYLAARTLGGQRQPFTRALQRVAQQFYPIFRESMLGKTIDALMGRSPSDVLPLLARAYRISVEGNAHDLELRTPNEALWRAEVEPVVWYPHTFHGIVRGALPDEPGLSVELDDQERVGKLMRFVFRIRW